MRRLAIGAFVVLLLAEAQAGVRPMTLGELCKGAERIVIGSVEKLQSRWEGSIIVTDVTVFPSENLKGAGTGLFQVTIPGGTVADTTLHVGEAPAFRAGETVVLFVRSGGPCGVYGWFRGKYTVVDDMVRERRNTSLAQFRAQIQAEVEKK